MAKRDKSAIAIQRLLDERRKIEQWLARLGMAADKTPDAVRKRVRGDYERRLDEVVAELQGYTDELQSSLETHQTTRDGLARQEDEASERLAEAELRHAVGEYGESEWAGLKAEILETLVKIREERTAVEKEIGDLEEILERLEKPAVPAAEAGEGDEDEAEAEEERDEEPEPVAAAPRRPSGPVAKPKGAQTDAFGDELAFLKSVTEDEHQGPAPSRASGSIRIPDLPEESSSDSAASRPSSGGERTLKCGECGALNLPTEWYCERCGAELASL